MHSDYSRVCDGCGITFSLQKASSRQHFCTRDCWYVFNRRSLADRLWAKVNKDGPLIRPEFGQCWEWEGTKLPRGYGHIWDIDKGRPIYTHRAAWKLASGEPIPEGMNVLHVCDNPACTRNDVLGVYVLRGVAFLRRGHLFLGTTADNAFDKADKGRSHIPDAEWARDRVLGEKNPMAILNASDVLEIRRLYDAGAATRTQLAQDFGVCYASVDNIVRRRSWQHLPR